jgi:glucose-1-phosphate adenylyltransferase
MVKANTNALGIIFPNTFDALVPELVSQRSMASIPFASRYRMIDFILSSMVNCGIDNISILARNNYHSLMDHLGSGREWDLSRKNGGLNIVPPYAEKDIKIYNGRTEALASILSFLRSQKEQYVVMSDTNIAVNFDFQAMIQAHRESGADITVAYLKREIPAHLLEFSENNRVFYYTYDIEDGDVKNIRINPTESGIQNFSMNIYVVDREFLINEISEAYVRGLTYFERDILVPKVGQLKVHAFQFDGYAAVITGRKSYLDENMRLLDNGNLDALFSKNPVYTKIRDDNPTRYIKGAKVSNIMAADGCVIEGEVENSVLFRGVKIGKGAKVKNCVLMQDTVVEAGVNIEYVITDKNVVITEEQSLKGSYTFPVFIQKHGRV